MGYYIRVLGTNSCNVPLDQLSVALQKEGLSAKFEVEDGTSENWAIISVFNSEGDPLAQIERNFIIEGELGQKELDELMEEIEEEQPASSVKWLQRYFNKVSVIYAFQILSAASSDDNYNIVSIIQAAIWNKTGGILQADNEGFTNEEGHHILWQFSDEVSGEWICAVKGIFGQWKSFTMDLGDMQQRIEFKKGQVPKKSIPL